MFFLSWKFFFAFSSNIRILKVLKYAWCVKKVDTKNLCPPFFLKKKETKLSFSKHLNKSLFLSNKLKRITFQCKKERISHEQMTKRRKMMIIIELFSFHFCPVFVNHSFGNVVLLIKLIH